MSTYSQTIVIGSGIGGLATAALLQHRRPDEHVLVLEAHTVSGGCASAYDRYIRIDKSKQKLRVRLDVGATTLSGLGGTRPVQRLLDELGLALDAVPMDPGIIITLQDGTIICRHADPVRWYGESSRVFGERSIGFWKEIDAIAARAWDVSTRYPRFPFASATDIIASGLRFRPSDLRLLQFAHTPLVTILRKHGLAQDVRFREFVDQLLMISVQCISSEASTLVAALGLEYPAHTFYVNGGLYAFAELLERSLVDRGGAIQHKTRITAIDYDQSRKRFTLTDSKGRSYECERLISNATIWNTAELLRTVPQSLKRQLQRAISKPYGEHWGAMMMTGVIGDSIDDGGSLYHQYHTSFGSLFLSLSRRGDTLRTPPGYRTISVSSHEPNAARWQIMDNETYTRTQQEALDRFDAVLRKRLPGYAEAEKLLLEMGTPTTFEFYTHRKHGWVGGITHSVKNWMPRWQPNVTSLDGFYLVGDTVFPGQGTPAVVQSAMNLCDRIASRN